MMRTLPLVALLSLALAHNASALDVSESVEVMAPPQKAWAMIAEFCSIENWHPAITSCVLKETGGDTTRSLTTGNGGKLLEQRLKASDENMAYTYKILESPLPISNYESTLSVRGSQGAQAATVEWRGTFDAAKGASDAKAKKAIAGIYKAGLDNIKKTLAEQ